MNTAFNKEEDIMMYTDFDGLSSEVATFNCNSSVTEAGQLVKMVGSGTVGKCTSGDNPIGVTVNVRNGYAAVQVKGYIKVPHDGTLTVGYHNISAADDKKLKLNSTNGIQRAVIESLNNVAGVIL